MKVLTCPTRSTLKYFPFLSNSSSFCKRKWGFKRVVLMFLKHPAVSHLLTALKCSDRKSATKARSFWVICIQQHRSTVIYIFLPFIPCTITSQTSIMTIFCIHNPHFVSHSWLQIHCFSHLIKFRRNVIFWHSKHCCKKTKSVTTQKTDSTYLMLIHKSDLTNIQPPEKGFEVLHTFINNPIIKTRENVK